MGSPSQSHQETPHSCLELACLQGLTDFLRSLTIWCSKPKQKQTAQNYLVSYEVVATGGFQCEIRLGWKIPKFLKAGLGSHQRPEF
ncbi:hypothetical protein LEMLEM_LOCUS16282 [Lemmus lemmus]